MWLFKRVYYAHSMRIYNTRREQQEIRFLRHKWYRVCNPNGRLTRYGWQEQSRRLIDQCDLLVFSEYCGYIGRGVYTEIMYALAQNKPVYVLREKELLPIRSSNLRYLGWNYAIKWGRVIF